MQALFMSTQQYDAQIMTSKNVMRYTSTARRVLFTVIETIDAIVSQNNWLNTNPITDENRATISQ